VSHNLIIYKKRKFSATLMTVGSVRPKRSSPDIKAGKILMHSAVFRSSCMGSSTFMHTPRHDASLAVVGLQQMVRIVMEPDPDPPDTHVSGPPRSRSISERYGSGSESRSFYHQAKIVRKTLIPTVL
jgi:hypothetical protein